jgi:preprotein translocase subunit SecG
MFGFFLTLLVLDGIFLSVIILLQAGKGGGLAAMGGGVTATEGVLGGRQATTFLVRASWAAGAAFMVLSLILAILSSRAQQPGSILQQEFQQVPTQPTPVIPGADAPPTGGAGAPGGGEGAIPDLP